MTENITEMRERHDQEIKDLQDNCTHEESTEWSEWYWAIGHKALSLRRWCKRCGVVTGDKPFQEQNPYVTEFQKPDKLKPKTTRFKKMVE